MKTEINKIFETEKPKHGQAVLKNVKYADKQAFERAKNKVFRDFDQQFRSLSKR